ncbi:uncharacterized protein LOC118663213 [Myotis myotis]|uniref:uncharacterized protein LOC118663213 n=1 Tax=Myotis myotis TaxID=51298 RepID=UPI00174D8100|nr:uncharacterized protein LOC118663213 [Myotis myotis]
MSALGAEPATCSVPSDLGGAGRFFLASCFLPLLRFIVQRPCSSLGSPPSVSACGSPGRTSPRLPPGSLGVPQGDDPATGGRLRPDSPWGRRGTLRCALAKPELACPAVRAPAPRVPVPLLECRSPSTKGRKALRQPRAPASLVSGPQPGRSAWGNRFGGAGPVPTLLSFSSRPVRFVPPACYNSLASGLCGQCASKYEPFGTVSISSVAEAVGNLTGAPAQLTSLTLRSSVSVFHAKKLWPL